MKKILRNELDNWEILYHKFEFQSIRIIYNNQLYNKDFYIWF